MNKINDLIVERNKLSKRIDEINEEIIKIADKKYNVGDYYKDTVCFNITYYKIIKSLHKRISVLAVSNDSIKIVEKLPFSFFDKAIKCEKEEFYNKLNNIKKSINKLLK